MLAVFVERGGSDAVQFAASKRRLQQIRRVHGSFAGPRADNRVQFIDEHDDLAVAVLDLLQHGFEPIFKLASVLGAGNEGSQVQREDALVFQVGRNVAQHDAVR